MKTKNIITIILLCLLFFLNSTILYAAQPYASYTYNYWGEPLPGPQAYIPYLTIDGEGLGIDKFTNLADIFVDNNENIYLVDSGANAIICLDKNWGVTRIIDSFEREDDIDTFNNPNGLFVTDRGNIYVADTDNERIIELDKDGNFIRAISRPESDIIDSERPYRPIKLVLDKALRIYVISQNWNQGIIELDSEGDFRGFIGASRVSPNPVEYFWKMIATKEQKKRSILFIPTEYNNIYMDAEGFIYVTTSALAEGDIRNAINSRSRDDRVAPVRRLNSTGVDVMRRYGFHPPVGDIAFDSRGSITGPSSFIDVAVDKTGIYSVLDRKRGRIFTYDSDGNLLYVFGGIGNQTGNFSNPVAIEYIGDKIAVLDSKLNNINIFDITEYGKMVKDAVALHFIGKYDDSALKWEEILKYNANLDLAYIGLGRAQLRQNNYAEAMKNFKLGNKRDYYSKAFQLYRKDTIEEKFGIIITGVILLAILLIVVLRRKRKFEKSEVGA